MKQPRTIFIIFALALSFLGMSTARADDSEAMDDLFASDLFSPNPGICRAGCNFQHRICRERCSRLRLPHSSPNRWRCLNRCHVSQLQCHRQCTAVTQPCRCPAGRVFSPESGRCLASEHRFCAQIYKPVCGCDGRTYANACLAANAGTMRWSVGRCQ
jgi:hypothetical protein